MKKVNINVIIIIILVVGLLVQQYFFSRTPDIDETILKKIESIENKLDTLSNQKDSVKTLIIKVEEQIDSNRKHHEEVVNTIITNNDSTNRVFIDNYIKRYIERITKE